MDTAFIQIVHLSTQKVLISPLGFNPWVQEGALSLKIKAFLLSFWENTHY